MIRERPSSPAPSPIAIGEGDQWPVERHLRPSPAAAGEGLGVRAKRPPVRSTNPCDPPHPDA
jgi:hypothetical protein